MKLKDAAVGARIGEIATRIDELTEASARDQGAGPHVDPPPGGRPQAPGDRSLGALDSAARELRSALAEVRALLGDVVVDSLIAALPEAASAALRDLPAELTAKQIQDILDRFFDFRHAFDSMEETALALQLPPGPAPHATRAPVKVNQAHEAAARQAIAEVNRAMQAAWPDIPADLLLRGPHGAGRGRLTVQDFKTLVTPGEPGVLTFEKLARRISGAWAGAPARLTAEQSLRLNQVSIPTSDLARSIKFYRGLGLQLIVQDDSSGYARLLLPDGGSTVSLQVAAPPISGSDVIIYFECDDLDDRVDRLRAAGYAFSSMPQDQTWLWREATLEDPDGQRLCLFCAGPNRRDPPWRLDDAVR